MKFDYARPLFKRQGCSVFEANVNEDISVQAHEMKKRHCVGSE
jgi:hypothetical protein